MNAPPPKKNKTCGGKGIVESWLDQDMLITK